MVTSETRKLSRSLKKVLPFVLVPAMIFTLSLGLCACGNGGVDQEISIKIPDSKLVGKRVSAPVSTVYFTDNNIKAVEAEFKPTEYITEEDSTLIQIEGLKNKEVQDKINKKIRETFEAMAADTTPPPYRGSKLAVRDYLDENGNPVPSEMSVDCYFEANYENILSIRVWKNIEFGTWDGETPPVWYTDPTFLNFDLNTGELLKLQDLFADNVDALKYINKYTENYLQNTDYESENIEYYTDQYEVKLTAPFKGFSEDVQFFVNDYDGSVNILLNYDTPEFYIGDDGRGYSTISVPFCEEMGYTGKFDSDEWLFEDPEVSYALIPGQRDELAKVRISDSPDSEDLGEWNYYDKTLEYYDYQSKAFLDYAKNDYESFDELDNMKKKIKEYGEAYDGDISATVYYDGVTSSMGRYECLIRRTVETYEYSDPEEYWNTIYSNETEQYITMDSADGRIMTVDDLLVDGIDFNDFFLKQMLAKKKDVEEWRSDDAGEFVWDENLEEYLKEMLKHINGFRLNERGLNFSFDENAEAMAADYITTDPDYLWYYAYLCSGEFEFKEMGCRNLKIFQ